MTERSTERRLAAAGAGRSGRTDLSELLSEDSFGVGSAATRPAGTQARSEVEVYVVELNLPDGSGWTSVHRTYEGARRRLEEKAEEWGVAGWIEGLAAEEVRGDTCTAAGEYGDPATYGISRLPVED